MYSPSKPSNTPFLSLNSTLPSYSKPRSARNSLNENGSINVLLYRPLSSVAISMLKSFEDEPLTTMQYFPELCSLLTNLLHPGASCTSSKKRYLGSNPVTSLWATNNSSSSRGEMPERRLSSKSMNKISSFLDRLSRPFIVYNINDVLPTRLGPITAFMFSLSTFNTTLLLTSSGKGLSCHSVIIFLKISRYIAITLLPNHYLSVSQRKQLSIKLFPRGN